MNWFIYMYLKVVSILICFIITANSAASQSRGQIYITGKVKVDQEVVDGTAIQIFRNEALLSNVSVNRTASFRVPLELDQVYSFKFIKDGFYPKTIEIDTHVPPKLCETNCDFPPYQIALTIYKKVPGVESISQDIPRISFNPTIDNFDAEIMREAASITNEIDKILADIKQQSIRYETETRNIKQQKYSDAISEANQLKQQNAFEKAMHRYRDALLMLPNQLYPREQVTMMYQILVKEQMVETLGPLVDDNLTKYVNYGDLNFNKNEFTVAKVAFDCALRIKPNEELIIKRLNKAQAEIDNINKLALDEVAQYQKVYEARTKRYNELVTLGNAKFRQELLVEAKDFYAQAATQIDERSYAVLMVHKIDDLMHDDDLAKKLAKENEEADKKKLMNARNIAYNDAVFEADRMFENRMYRDAVEYYELALTIKSYELYPANQIRIIREILAKMQLNGGEYNSLIRDADALMNGQKYEEALVKYQRAHQIIPDEKYALQKIEEIKRLLKKSQIDIEIQQKYDDLIAKADNLYVGKNYQEAIVAYQEALLVKPNEKYPSDQINKAREFLSRESNEQKRQEQLLSDYNRTVAMADKAFNQESYSPARSLYLDALRIFPGQEYPQNQINKIDVILESQRKGAAKLTQLDQIDFSNLQNMNQADCEAAFKDAIALGESFMKSKEWGIARFYFRRAQALMPGNEQANKKVNEVETIIRGDNANELKYDEMIQRGDEAFKTGDFSVARFYYIKAKEAKPADEYVNERIQVTSQLVESSSSRVSNREYDIAINKADEAMQAKNYSVARFFYRKALSIKANDDLANRKLKEVEQLINQ